MKNIIKAFFDSVLNFATRVVRVMIYPITAIADTIFPDISSYVSQITTFFNNQVVPLISYFSNMLPPITKSIILLWIGFLGVYYAAVWTYTLAIKLFVIIRKIKFW